MRKLLSVMLLMGILTGCTGSKAGAQLPATPSTPATPVAPAAVSKVISQELTADGIHLGSTADEVQRTLGSPETKKNYPQVSTEVWTYPARGLSIGVMTDKLVHRIAIEPPSKLRTLKGIGVDDPVSAVTQAYGPSDDLKYQFTEHVGIFFSQSDGKVTVITLFWY